MIRAAAKNHAHVSVCVDSSDYDELLLILGGDQEGPEAASHRKLLAWKAYQHCASYDTAVADWLWQQVGESHCQDMLLSPMQISCGFAYFSRKLLHLLCLPLLAHNSYFNSGAPCN